MDYRQFLQVWINSSDAAKTLFAEAVSQLLLNLNTQDTGMRSGGQGGLPSLMSQTIGNGPYPWGNAPLFNIRPPFGFIQQPLQSTGFMPYSGPPNQHFPAPRIPRMPYYHQQQRRARLPTPRAGPSRQQPFYRNHPSRRRHHLDDIFLPNHDDEETPPQEEESRSRHPNYRPPVRVPVRTTKTETITRDKPASATESNERVSSEKVSDTNRYERTCSVTDRKNETNDIRDLNKNSKNIKLDIKGGINGVVSTSESNKTTFDVVGSSIPKINEKKISLLETKTNVPNISLRRTSETTNKKKDVIGKPIQSVPKTSTFLVQNKSKITENHTKTSTCSTKKATFIHQNNPKIDESANSKNSSKINEGKQGGLYLTNSQTPEKEVTKESKGISLTSCANNKSQNLQNKKDNEAKDAQQKLQGSVLEKNTLSNKQKCSNMKNRTGNKLKNNTAKTSPKEKTDFNRETDIVKELEALLNNSDGHTLSVNKCPKNQAIQDDQISKNICEKLTRDSIEQTDTLKEGSPTQDTTPPLALSSPQAITKDIRINLINLPLPKSPLAADKINKSCFEELEALKNRSANHTLSVNKCPENQAIQDDQISNACDKLTRDSIEPTDTLKEGFLTQDTTPTSVPSSPQAIKKDIRINLINLPPSKSPLAANKINECYFENKEFSKTVTKSKDIPCTDAKMVNSKITVKLNDKANVSKEVRDNLSTVNKFTEVDVLKPDSVTTTKAVNDNVSENSGKNTPILEDIFILDDALKNIEHSEIIEVPSSPSNKDSNAGISDIGKETINDGEILEISTPKSSRKIDCGDVQIIEEKCDTIEIIDDDDHDLSFTTDNSSHGKSTIPIDVIKIESPEICKRNLKGPTNVEKTLNHDQPLEDFCNLDTRGSFLWTFHQRFDDPRVVDMDISHSPSPPEDITASEEPKRSEQQIETDRFIDNMNPLWNEISNENVDESNLSRVISKPVKLKGIIESNKDAELTGNQLKNVIQTGINAKNDKQCKKLTSVALETEKKNTDIISKLNLNKRVPNTLSKKEMTSNAESGYTTMHRRASFSNENSLNGFKKTLRRTKSLNNLVAINKSNCSSSTAAVSKYIGNLIHRVDDKSNRISKGLAPKDNIWPKSPTERELSDYKDELLLLLSSSGYDDKIENVFNNGLEQMPKTVANKSVVTDDDASDNGSSSVSIGKVNKKKRHDIRRMKRKKIMRIESSDEELKGEPSKKIRKDYQDEPKQKKLKLKKPTRKREHMSDNKDKNKEPVKDIKTQNDLLINKEIRVEAPPMNRSNSSPNKTSSAQPSTKYVTKAEYVKSFAKNKSPVPNISLSIEPFSKTKNIIKRRATFTCEADNETILKKVDNGERCKQKFLDLFGSVSEDEEDLIQVPITKICKKSSEADKNVYHAGDLSYKKDETNRKRKRSSSSKPGIKKSSICDSSETNSNSGSVLSTDKDLVLTSKTLKQSKKCKLSSINNGNNLEGKKEITDGIQIPQSKYNILSLNKKEATNSKLDRQNCKEQSGDINTNKKHYKDAAHTKCDLSNRRESTSSTDSKSSKKNNPIQLERVSRSLSKESDSSSFSEREKHISKNGRSKDNKGHKSEKRSFNKGYSNSKVLKKSFSNYRRDSISSIDSNNSGHNHENIDKNSFTKIEHRRKSVSKHGKVVDGNDKKETDVAVSKYKQEATKLFCEDSNGSKVTSKTHLPITEGSKKCVTESFYEANQKSGLDNTSKVNNVDQLHKKTLNSRNKQEADLNSLKVSSLTHKERTFNRSADASTTAIDDREKSSHTPSTKKIKQSSRRNSTPDILDRSLEKSLINEINDIPLLYRSSEGELNETFQYCQVFTSPVIKYDKITRITIVDLECTDNAQISEPTEIHTDTKIVAQNYKDDDDVIEIRPVIPMVDLTEEDIRESSASRPQENFGDLLLEAKKEFKEIAQDQATITLYRSEEDDNQDEEVQAVSVSIPLAIAKKNTSEIKQGKNVIQQDATTASSAEACLQSLNSKNISNDKEITDLETVEQKIPEDAEKGNRAVSAATSQQFSNLVQELEINVTAQEDNTILESSPENSGTVITGTASQLSTIHDVPTSLEDENQRAVSSILDIRQHDRHLGTNIVPEGIVECTTNKDLINVQFTQGTTSPHINVLNESLNFKKAGQPKTKTSPIQIHDQIIFKAVGTNSVQQNVESYTIAEPIDRFEKQNNSNASESRTTRSESHELSQLPSSDVAKKNVRPRIIVRPTRAQKNADDSESSLQDRLRKAQHLIVEDDISGQHRGLPQTLREYRPSNRIKTNKTFVPPLVNINGTVYFQKNNKTSPQKPSNSIVDNNTTKNTCSPNLGTKNIQNISVESNQVSPQNSIANINPVIDLTEDNGELSTMNMRVIVDIFTRHTYFLAHLCKAQNNYIDYLKQQNFCQGYFKAEVALFEDQKQARLLSQSLRLATELNNLNIRATRNLSSTASEIVERITINLVNRNMPKEVTRSMVYLLIVQLINPQSDLFAKIPLLKALTRICNIVVNKMTCKSAGVLTEAQRKVLIHQVKEYNRLCGRPSSPYNQSNTGLPLDQPNTDQLMANNQSLLRSSLSLSGGRYALSDNPVNIQSKNNFVRQIPTTNQQSTNVRQSPAEVINPSPIAKLTQQFGSNQQFLLKPTGNSTTVTANLSGGPQNYQLNAIESLPAVCQASVVSNSMNPPRYIITKIRPQKKASPKQPRSYVAPNNLNLTRSSFIPTQHLPGGANTNTLGCTPRYIPNYDTPNHSHMYASLGRPLQPQHDLNSVSKNVNQLNSNTTQVLRGALIRLKNSNNPTNNPMLLSLLNDGNSTGLGKSNIQQGIQQISTPQSPLYNSSEQSFLQQSSHMAQSVNPRQNIAPPSPRQTVASQTSLYDNSSRQPPSYEQSIANKLSSSSSNPLPNQLPVEETKKRNESLLQELLCSQDDEPVFAKPSSPVNDNFRIKLPFTQPDVTPSTTVHTTCANSSSLISQPRFTISTYSQSNVQNHEGSSLISLNSQATSEASVVLVNNTAARTSYVVGQPTNTVVLNQGLAALSSIGPASAMLNSSSDSSDYVQNSQPTLNVINSLQYQESLIVNQPIGSQATNPIIIINCPNLPQQQNQISVTSTEVVRSQNPIYAPIAPRPSPESNLNQAAITDRTISKVVAVTDKEKNPEQVPSLKNVKSKMSNKINTNVTKPKTKSSSPKKRGRPKRKKGTLSTPMEIVELLSSDDDIPLENTSSEEGRTSEDPEYNRFKTTEKPIQAEISKVNPEYTDQRQTGNQNVGQSCASQSTVEDANFSSSYSQNHEAQPVTPLSQSGSTPLSQSGSTPLSQSGSTPLSQSGSTPLSQSGSTPLSQSGSTPLSQSGSTPLSQSGSIPLSQSGSTPLSQSGSTPLSQSGSFQIPNSLIDDLQPSRSPNHIENTNEEDDVETIDLTWIDDMDDQELQREMDFVFIKKEEPRNDEQVQERNMAVPSPADSGISSPPVQGEDDTTVYTVNVQRLCICAATAQYNCVCGEAWYCGQECQIQDWESHQKVCQSTNETVDTEHGLNEQEADTSDKT